ncbi:hypothetical protein [Chryseobacterium oryzae]|uniref:Uncharacterized protein n=1 Tax=Chryseobacterium oryzae TaxID=2929799 RepID=A0ABY4BPH7_9FLAO|nr:hypothetical protein [Chryseobacterium oryzae]UOE39691.1 hypothetical protein MTP08_14685 [Chryseobacterium oryzae]
MKKYFKNLLEKKLLSDNHDSFLKEFFEVLEEGYNVYYPSCGYDFSDLYYINSANLPEIGFEPKVFIHSDMSYLDKSTVINEMKCSDVDFQITFEVKIKLLENSEILFFKFKNTRNLDEKFLVIFSGFLNEDILKLLSNSSCKIPLVYSICDGITSGMGYEENSVSTIFYPAISTELGLKFIITEQSGDFDYRNINITSSVDSLLKFCDKKWLYKNSYQYDKIRSFIYKTLQKVPEKFINEPQIKIYTSHKISSGLLIKTIPENFDFWVRFEEFLTNNFKQSTSVENGNKINVFAMEDKDAKNDETESLIIKLLPYTTFEQLAKLPEIGKISKKLKRKFVTPLNLFLSDDSEAFDIRNVIDTSLEVQNYLLSTYLLYSINQNHPIVPQKITNNRYLNSDLFC